MDSAADRSQFSYLQALLSSFFSAALYRDVARRWRGAAFFYLFLLLAILWTLPTYRVSQSLHGEGDAQAKRIIDQVPHISIEDGELSANVDQPYEFKDPSTGETVMIIDTTGKTQELPADGAKVLVGRRQITFRKSEFETRTFDYGALSGMDITKDALHEWWGVFMQYAMPLYYGGALLSSFSYRTFQAFVYALFAMFFAGAMRVPLSFLPAVRLSVVSLTPVLIVGSLLTFLGITLPFGTLISFIVEMGYLFFAVRTLKQEQTTGIAA